VDAEVSITMCANGPFLVRGEIPLVAPSGETIEQTRKTIALCRCGASTIKPFCDGTHKLIHFSTE
jgi:CDGSH-type Zn-finger protein